MELPTFYSPKLSSDENAKRARVRSAAIKECIRASQFDLLEYFALGISGEDIGDCIEPEHVLMAVRADCPVALGLCWKYIRFESFGWRGCLAEQIKAILKANRRTGRTRISQSCEPDVVEAMAFFLGETT